jgi:hypothetical protein
MDYFEMRTLKAIFVAALIALVLVGLLATNAIATVAQTFCMVSVVVFAATSFFGLAAKLRT